MFQRFVLMMSIVLSLSVLLREHSASAISRCIPKITLRLTCFSAGDEAAACQGAERGAGRETRAQILEARTQKAYTCVWNPEQSEEGARVSHCRLAVHPDAGTRTAALQTSHPVCSQFDNGGVEAAAVHCRAAGADRPYCQWVELPDEIRPATPPRDSAFSSSLSRSPTGMTLLTAPLRSAGSRTMPTLSRCPTLVSLLQTARSASSDWPSVDLCANYFPPRRGQDDGCEYYEELLATGADGWPPVQCLFGHSR